MTKFDQAVKVKERLVRKAMVAYLGAASQFTGRYYNTTVRHSYHN
jgi:hypothetical protein